MHTHEYNTESPQSQADKFVQEVLEKYKGLGDVFKGTDHKYHYIYLTINKHNSHFYIGKHSSSKHPDKDTYIGSGWGFNKAIKKYGRQAFINHKLKFFECEQDAFAEEAEIVSYSYIQKYNNELRVTYNLTTGGIGGGIPSEETRARFSEVKKGKKLSEQDKENKRKAANRPETREVQKKKRLNRKWVNNGQQELWLYPTEAQLKTAEEGWKYGRLTNIIRKMIEGSNKKKAEILEVRRQERAERLEVKRQKRAERLEADRKRKKQEYEDGRQERKNTGVLKMKQTFATEQSILKRRKASTDAQAYKPMIDLEGNSVKIHKDNILQKLKEGYILVMSRVRLVNPCEPVGNRKVTDIQLTGKYGVDAKARLLHLINCLEQGLVFGMR
jgi:hypothetical protein